MFSSNNQFYKLAIILSIILLSLIGLLGVNTRFTSADAHVTDILVDINTGLDTPNCGAESQPCASIQYVVNMAPATNQTIRVARGTYTFNAATDTCSGAIGTTAVICIRNKAITILGGYTASNWTVADPNTNITIIDGQNSKRGILVQHGTDQPAAILHMDGFTVQNGRVQGASSGSDSATFAFGGGMRADNSSIHLSNMIFKNNKALGGNTNSDYGGAASGGGVSIRASANTGHVTTLEHITFDGNQAIGGSGANRGGYGIGGGLFTFQSNISGSHITFTNNLSKGGDSNGSGISNNNNADAQGGGASFHRESSAMIQYITVTNNRTIGGNALNGQGGGSFGGGVYAEVSTHVELIDALIHGNLSQGGHGKNSLSGGSVSFGGGVASTNTAFTLKQSTIINNQSIGGNGTQISGSGNGGGASFTRTTSDVSSATIINSVIANNLAAMGSGNVSGGGGGGIYMRGANAVLEHVTLAQNEIGSANMQGSGMVLLSSSYSAIANISNSIFAEHTIPNNSYTLHVQPGNTITFNTNLLSGNSSNTGGGGTFNGNGTNFSGPSDFVSAGAPNYDYHINNGSVALGKAAGSTTAIDIDDESRFDFGSPDVGADEFSPIILTAVSADGQLHLQWDATAELLAGLDHYQIQVTPSGGASDPAEGISIDAGAQTSFLLTGLTNYKNYTIVIDAQTGANATFAQSNTITAFPTDLHVYLPTILK